MPTTYDHDGNFVFLDDDFAKIYAEELAENTNWSIFVQNEHSFTFYNSLSENLDKNHLDVIEDVNLQSLPEHFSRSLYGNLAELHLYDDRDYADTTKDFYLTSSATSIQVPDLKSNTYKFNDKCSSFKLHNALPNDPNTTISTHGGYSYPCSNVVAVFIGFDDKNYADRSIVATAEPSSHKLMPSIPNFNDKMSSFKFLFAVRGLYQSTL